MFKLDGGQSWLKPLLPFYRFVNRCRPREKSDCLRDTQTNEKVQNYLGINYNESVVKDVHGHLKSFETTYSQKTYTTVMVPYFITVGPRVTCRLGYILFGLRTFRLRSEPSQAS
jgi:hypothetical protein